MSKRKRNSRGIGGGAPASRQLTLKGAMALARNLCDEGKPREAEAVYRQILDALPDRPSVVHNLALVVLAQGRNEEAVALLRRAVQLDGDYAEAHVNLGNALAAQGHRDEAAASIRRGIELKPELPHAYNNLASVLQSQGRAEQAAEHLRRAIELDPSLAAAHHNLGTALLALGRPAEAAAAFDKAVALAPTMLEALQGLGNARLEGGDLDGAVEAYDRALAVRGDYAEAHACKAIVGMLRGDFPASWAGYEWRNKCPSVPPRSFDRPRWGGEKLAGRRILLHCEQGFGDVIQFARYAPLVAARGGRVVLECQPQLQRLLEGMPGVEQLVTRGAPLPPFDLYCPLLSVPGVFATTLETVPADVPYLRAKDQDSAAWRERLGSRAGPRVGIVWSGDPRSATYRHKFVPVELLAGVLAVGGISFYSLQVGKPAGELSRAFEGKVADLAPDIRDFADTSATMSQLDLVITVDTAAAHLAGALAIPVWIMLRVAPDWRWMLDRRDSPWYPTARLFRQRRRDDWAGVLECVAAELAAWARAKGARSGDGA